MILYEGAFYNAKVEFISQERFEKNNWVKYTKHDYTDFNVVHTWFEYINRLLGVLAGFSVLFMFIFSFFLSEKRVTNRIPWKKGKHLKETRNTHQKEVNNK